MITAASMHRGTVHKTSINAGTIGIDATSGIDNTIPTTENTRIVIDALMKSFKASYLGLATSRIKSRFFSIKALSHLSFFYTIH